MAAATYNVARQFTRQTRTGAATYADVTGCSFASTDFVAGKKYLLMVTGILDATNNNVTAGVKVLHGTTDFADSEYADEPDVNGGRMAYSWFGVWTAVASEGIKLQFKTTLSGETVGITHVVMFWIKLSDDFVENTDWFETDNAVSTALPQPGDTSTDNASVSFTPPAGTDWLVMSSSRTTGTSANSTHRSKLVSTGTFAESLPESLQEGESGADSFFMHTIARVFKALGAVAQSFTEISGMVQTGLGTEVRTHSKVFAINLSKFKDVASAYTPGQLDGSATDFATQYQTVSITPAALGDFLLIGWWALVPTVTGIGGKIRIQVDNTDSTAGQTTDALLIQECHDSADRAIMPFFDIANLSAAAHTIDMDGSVEAAVAGRGGVCRSLIALSMELAPGAGGHATPDFLAPSPFAFGEI